MAGANTRVENPAERMMSDRAVRSTLSDNCRSRSEIARRQRRRRNLPEQSPASQDQRDSPDPIRP
jgi:hypothetical protein